MAVMSGTWTTTVKQRQPRHLVIVLLFIFLLATFQSLRKLRSQTGHGDFTSPSVTNETASIKKRLLVTGAAGFIGMSLSIALAADGHTVVGIDDFNDYYDVDLKRDRAYELYRRNIEVLQLDVCDRSGLQEIFKEHRFTHVVHLAAQAGVRYSIENPLAYVRANVQCFATLLEVVRHFPGIFVTYASSSSVYGRNTKVPFDVSDRIDSPSSLYAATKKSNEDFARVYHHLYKIPMTGLRFFTVYGPWGRPDMAVYKFSAQIMENRSIDVYDEGTLQRDFTYIDDIVDGIKAAINHGANFEIFNIGKGHPETVSDLIAGLENVLEKRANKNYLPMQPGDVKITYADIGHTRSQLGFAPKISLQEGLYRWAAWYLERREDLERGNFVRQKEYYEKQIETGVSQESTLVTAVPKIRKGGTAGGVVLTSILEYSEAAMNCLKSLYRYQIPSIVFVSKEVLSTLDTVTFKNATVQILLIGDDELWRMNCFRHLKAHLLGLVKMQKAPEYLVFVESKKVDFSRNPFSDIQRTHKENGFTFFFTARSVPFLRFDTGL
ncbi:hypothetical protein SARC_12262 [Sphaeroforma arctica JP610]|uniref:NAD-dependent epimerase/dehydratase domain-containing protein n=1 Tax=Sphaeroforma arctica JP610 TaxID=667725 RepID=A0A0L0FEL5_9EUKA|nr:hypothetical protein SARC_12262 [Sphaeroforma arctica JP610]KNC75207.1 hypothetical protein SARC_12262 [Sphaeroforma arctica JP610]|eukprot:XP_014149109.1 hypothetical protein SARC_12262 [Sphaeroforma arctica JP610]